MADRHTNLNTLTDGYAKLGVGGPRMRGNSGVVEARNAADGTFAVLRGADAAGADDLLNRRKGLRPIVTQVWGGSLVWTTMPSTTTALFGGLLTATPLIRVDLTNYETVRTFFNMLGTLGAAGTKGNIQASLDKATWLYLDGTAAGALVAQAGTIDLTVQGYSESTDITLHASLRALVYLRAIGIGNDIIGPLFGPLGVVAS